MRKLPFGVLLLLVLTLFVACSEDNSQLQVGNVAMQSAQIADIEERGFLPLGALPMETLVTMDRVERSAWQKLSTRFYITKVSHLAQSPINKGLLRSLLWQKAHKQRDLTHA